jgi:hypothetical protein
VEDIVYRGRGGRDEDSEEIAGDTGKESQWLASLFLGQMMITSTHGSHCDRDSRTAGASKLLNEYAGGMN